jgi:hypothetical protein
MLSGDFAHPVQNRVIAAIATILFRMFFAPTVRNYLSQRASRFAEWRNIRNVRLTVGDDEKR